MVYFLLHKREEGIFGHLTNTQTLIEAKKAKSFYHNQFKIPLGSLYIVKTIVG